MVKETYLTIFGLHHGIIVKLDHDEVLELLKVGLVCCIHYLYHTGKQ